MSSDLAELRTSIELAVGRLPEPLPGYAPPPTDNLAPLIDHTVLKPEATTEQVRRLCQEASVHRFASVCINPTFVPLAADALSGTGVDVCTVIGFPLGASSTAAKAGETRIAVAAGATEVDMVLPVGRLIAEEWDAVHRDIRSVVEAAGGRAKVKVIFETCLLTDPLKHAACWLCMAAGAHYVKTSTGFGSAGATVEDVRLMREAVGAGLGVKAAGGIRTRDDALKMVEAGASRLGCSASIAIVQA